VSQQRKAHCNKPQIYIYALMEFLLTRVSPKKALNPSSLSSPHGKRIGIFGIVRYHLQVLPSTEQNLVVESEGRLPTYRPSSPPLD